MARGGYVTDLDEVVASSDLKEELKSKMKEGDKIVAFAYTDYGGSFGDKVAIEYFKENHPKNIVFENSAYNGQNGIVFGEVAKDFLEETEDYPLGYEDMESFYYDMQNAQEEKDFKLFLSDIKNKYTIKKDALDWLLENKGGYYSIEPNMVDFSYSELENELEEEGLIKKKKMADGGMMDDGGEVEEVDYSEYHFNVGDELHLGSMGIKYFKEWDGGRIIVVDSRSDLDSSKGSYIYPYKIKKVVEYDEENGDDDYAKGGKITRNKNKNDYNSMFNFFIENNYQPIGKRDLIEMAYASSNGVDSAIPQSMVGDVDNTAFYVYDYQTDKMGELVDLRMKLKFSNVKVDVTIVQNGELKYGRHLPYELENATFHQALNYVFTHDDVEQFNIRPRKKFELGGAIEDQYEGRSPQDIWDSLDSDQRYHFIDDHALQIEMIKDKNYDSYSGKFPKSISGDFLRKVVRSEWENLDEVVQNRFANHVRQGEYAKGGMMADGSAIKGSNPSTGEKFGVVIGSLEKDDDGLTTLTIRSIYSARIKSYELTFDERGFLRSIGDFGHTIDGTYPDMKGGHLSVKNVNADNKKESIDALAKITSPSFAKKVYEYVHEEKMAKGGKVSYREAGENYEYVNTFGIEQRDFEKIVDAYHKSPSSDQIDRIDSRMTFNEMRTKYGAEKVDEVGNYIHKTHQSHGKMAKGGKTDNIDYSKQTTDDFTLGEIVYDVDNKRYGTVIAIYDKYNSDKFELRLDSDGVQPTENLRKVGSKGDKGTKEQLNEAITSYARLVKEYGKYNDYPKQIKPEDSKDDDKPKNKWEYTDKDEIEYVVVKDKNGKELKFDGKYVISGVHDLLEKGGKLTEIGKYYSKNDVVSVFVNGKNILDKNTVSGVWIQKDAKPMAEDVAEMKIGKTSVTKGVNGWKAKTMVDNFKGFDWDITTIKNSRGDLTTTAQGGKSEDKGGYKIFTFMLYQDPSIRLKSSRPARVNEKVVSEQHAEAMKDWKERQDEISEKVDQIQGKKKMADGGAIGFDALAKKVAKNYEGDKVKKEFQDEYGKTYDKKEAEEVGKKVAGKVYRQQQAKGKMAKGGKVDKKNGTPANRSQSKMTLISRKASEIRKANEPWRDAFNRAKAMLYS